MDTDGLSQWQVGWVGTDGSRNQTCATDTGRPSRVCVCMNGVVLMGVCCVPLLCACLHARICASCYECACLSLPVRKRMCVVRLLWACCLYWPNCA